MKNNRKYLLVFIVLIVFAAIYFFSNTEGTLNLRNSRFSVSNPENITQINIIEGENHVTLIKYQGKWTVGNGFKARPKSVIDFITILSRVDVYSPVSKAEKDQVASILKADGLKVEIFKKKRKVREYYVSKPSMNKEKTYMMMVRSNEPFIVRAPSLNINISNLFIAKESFWRDRTLFDYQPQNIKNVTVTYPDKPKKSFAITYFGKGSFALKEIVSDSYLEDFNPDKLSRYFTYFQNIRFENIATGLSQEETDSIQHTSPFAIIQVEDINGNSNELKIFRKPAENKIDEFGEKVKFDYNKAYASFNENSELFIIQYYICDPLLKEIDYFR